MSDKLVTLIGGNMTRDEVKKYKEGMWAKNPKGRLKPGDLPKATDNLLSKLKEVEPKLICPKTFLS